MRAKLPWRDRANLIFRGHNNTTGITRGAWIGLKGQKTMVGRILKAVFMLVGLGFAGLTGYAYLADLSPTQTEVTLPVTLNAD